MSQLIVDTNIIQYLVSNRTASAFQSFFSEYIRKNDLSPSISEYSKFELLRGATLNQESNILAILSLFQHHDVSSEILLGSAWLDTCYQMDYSVSFGISDGDKIIASTAIFTKGLILTANARDFPWPFFIEKETHVVWFKDKNQRSRMIPIAILEPNLELISDRMESRK